MEKEQKEMWKNWESWKGFNDWLNSKLKEDYIKKGILPPFTDPFGGVFTRMIPRQCLDECPKDNYILVKMTGICWEWGSPQERYAYDHDMEGDRGFAEEAVVQIDLDLTFEKVSDDILPKVLWETLCDADIGPWEPVRFEYEIINKEPSKPVKVSCLYGNCKVVEDMASHSRDFSHELEAYMTCLSKLLESYI